MKQRPEYPSFEQFELENQRERARELRRKGLSPKVIAARLGSMGTRPSAGTVRGWTRDIAAPLKSARRVARSDGEVYETLQAASMAAGCSASTLKRRINRGLPVGEYSYEFKEE